MSEKMQYEELLVQFDQFDRDVRVESILKEVTEEFWFLKDDGVDRFAQQLQQRDQQRRLAQSEREELVRVCQSPGHCPQLTCDWFIQGLDFVAPGWRKEFKRKIRIVVNITKLIETIAKQRKERRENNREAAREFMKKYRDKTFGMTLRQRLDSEKKKT